MITRLATTTLAFALVICVLGEPPAHAITRTWVQAATATAWYTNAHWDPATPAGGWQPGDVAQFNNTGSATQAGINMNTAQLTIGAIEVTSLRTRNLVIGNSSTSAVGNLTLNGATIQSVDNVILYNAGTNPLTLQPTQGSGSEPMTVVLGNETENVIHVAGGGGVVVTSVIAGVGKNLTFQSTGAGTLTLGAENTYSGNTTINSGQVNVNATSTLGNGEGTLVLNGGTLNMTNNRGALATPNTVNVTAPSSISNTATGATPQIIFSGVFTGDGTSALTLRNNGATVEYNVRLSNTAINFANPIVLDNGTGGGVTQLQSSNSTGTHTFSGVISGGGRYVRLQAGTTYLTGANSYSGGTMINNGTVYASNSNLADSATGSGAVTVNNGGTLGGVGRAAGAVTVNSGGTLAPGESVGTLTLGDDVDLVGALSIEYDDTLGGQQMDVAAVVGDLDIAAGTLSFSDISMGSVGLSQPAYIFARYGTLTGGSFASVVNLPVGYTIDYAYNDGVSTNNIALVAAIVPEASAFLFGGLACAAGGIGAVVARRRRQKS